jgi:hypothetical protein
VVFLNADITNGTGANDTITGFNANDTLVLSGYGTKPVALDQVASGGTSQTLTLTDGTKLLFSDFGGTIKTNTF